MLTAIELHYNFCGMTGEVGDVVFDRYLASEAYAVQPVIAEFRPEDSFGIGGVLSKFARVRTKSLRDVPSGVFWIDHRHLRCGETPTPTLPRKRERGFDQSCGKRIRFPETKIVYPKRSLFPLPLAGEG